MVISHDRYFLNKVINKIYELNEDGIKEYQGNYSYYVEKKKSSNSSGEFEHIDTGLTKTKLQEEKEKAGTRKG